jgi:hypothetical protein
MTRRSAIVIALLASCAGTYAIEFEFNSNKIYVPVQVNERGPFWFIVDTGSIANVVDAERAKSLGIQTSGSYDVHGAGEGSLPAASAKQVSLRLGDISVWNSGVEVFPINHAVSHSEGRVIDGLLGCPFFERFIVRVDYPRRQISVEEPRTFKYVGKGQSIPIEIRRGNIFVKARVVLFGGERVEGTFLVDSGWRAALSLTSPFVRQHHLPGSIPTISATTGVGIGGPGRDLVGRVDALEFGPYIIKQPVTDFSQASGGVMAEADMAGIIGGEILRRFDLVLDYPHHRLLLEPNEQLDQPYQFDTSGLFVTAHGPNLRSFTIFSVVNGSPAAEAALRPEDTIETINEEPASKFTLEEIRQLFRREGQHYSLGIDRAGQPMQVNLTTRRLI